MARRCDFLGFLVLALALHLALWPRLEGAGVQAAGSGGTARQTLAAATPALSALIAVWEAPPVAQDVVTPPEAPAPDPAPQVTAAAPAPELAEPARLATRPARPVPAPVGLDSPAPALPADADTVVRPSEDDRPVPPSAPALPEQAAPPPTPAPDTAPPDPVLAQVAPETAPRPAARPAPTSGAAQPRPAQVAAGSGGGAAAGNDGSAQESAGSGDSQQAMARWGARIRAAIERRKRYPRGSRASGTARVTFSVTASGKIDGASLAASSGDAALDAAALAAVRAARIPAAPEGIGPGPHRFTVPIAFSP